MDKQAVAIRQADLMGGAQRLRDEIAQLKELLQQKEADLYATNGAIEDCAYWMERIEMEGLDALQRKFDETTEEASEHTIMETSEKTLTDFVKMAQGNGEYYDGNGF